MHLVHQVCRGPETTLWKEVRRLYIGEMKDNQIIRVKSNHTAAPLVRRDKLRPRQEAGILCGTVNRTDKSNKSCWRQRQISGCNICPVVFSNDKSESAAFRHTHH